MWSWYFVHAGYLDSDCSMIIGDVQRILGRVRDVVAAVEELYRCFDLRWVHERHYTTLLPRGHTWLSSFLVRMRRFVK